VASILAVASARPYQKSLPAVSDTLILQYALTLEHLENAFYSGALAKYDESAFTKAGLPSWARGRFEQVASHEAIHVSALTAALGKDAVAHCEYSFPYTDPASFAALSSILESAGVSAYLGAAQFIQNKQYLTVAGSILTTEARHQAWVSSAVRKEQPWSSAFDTPLGFNQIFSLAAPFITSCPHSNPPLPFKAFPTLKAVINGNKATYSFNSTRGALYYAAYYHGLNVQIAPLDSSKRATIPDGLQGTYFTVITTASDGNVTDANTIAGPLITVSDFPASARN